MTQSVYHIQLNQHERDALISLQHIGSGLAMATLHPTLSLALRHRWCEQWKEALSIIQPALRYDVLIPTRYSEQNSRAGAA